MTADTPLLTINDLQVRYGPALALNDLSLTLAAGTSLAVLGPNGAGKSTLARTISGLVPATRGSIEYDGADITGMAAHRRRRNGIVYLPEGRGIFPGLTVSENVRMAGGLLNRTDRHNAVEHAFEVFPALAERKKTKAGLLSGGEQQMLSLSRALVVSPRLIIADEMSLGLAPKMVDLVFESLDRLKSNGVTLMLIEQFVHRALAFADECLLLSRGNVAWQGEAASAHHDVLSRYLGETAATAVA